MNTEFGKYQYPNRQYKGNRECDIFQINKIYKKKYHKIQKKIKEIINFITNDDEIIHYSTTTKTGGDGVYIHSDNSKFDGNKWVPNHSPTRTWSASLLLNNTDQFKGGKFKFYSPAQTVDLQKGDLLVFKSDLLILKPSNSKVITEILCNFKYL